MQRRAPAHALRPPVAQPCELRDYFLAHPDHTDADVALLRFAVLLWLVQQAKLNEG